MPVDGTTRRRVFVVYRYNKRLKNTVEVLKRLLDTEPATSSARWRAVDLNDVVEAGEFLLNRVTEEIDAADYVVVFAESASLNVAFEAGIAYGQGKPTLIFVPEGKVHEFTKAFSDLSGVYLVSYDPEEIADLPDELVRRILAIESRRSDMEKKEPSAQYLVAWGDRLRGSGHYADAIDRYTAALHAKPEYQQALVGLGQAYLAVYDLVRAEEALRTAVEKDSKCVPALEALGQVLLDSGQYAQAAEVYQQLLEMSPAAGRPYYFKLAVAHCENQEPAKGVKVLRDGVDRLEGPARAALWYDLAWCAMRAARLGPGTPEADSFRKQASEALAEACRLDKTFGIRARRDCDLADLR